MLSIDHSGEPQPTYIARVEFVGTPVRHDELGRVTDPRVLDFFRLVRDELVALGDIRDVNLSDIKSEWHDDRLEDPLTAEAPAAPHIFRNGLTILFDDVTPHDPVPYGYDAVHKAFYDIKARDRAITDALYRGYNKAKLLHPDFA